MDALLGTLLALAGIVAMSALIVVAADRSQRRYRGRP